MSMRPKGSRCIPGSRATATACAHALDADGHFREEAAKVFGVPFDFQEAVGALAQHIRPVNHQGEETELPVIAPGREGMRSTALVDFYTGRTLEPAAKSHVNALVIDSRWEKAAAFCLDMHPGVRAWVKNDHLGFVIPYRSDGAMRKYLPDFVIELNDGARSRWIVEIKGEERPDDLKKQAAAERWVRAVNRDGRFGRWAYRYLTHPADLAQALDTISPAH